MGIVARISKNNSILNMLWLSGDSILRMGLGFILNVWLARYMGPEKFGIFNYAMAMIAIYVSVASLGMNGVVVRELVRDPQSSDKIMGTSFLLQVLGSLLASLLVVLSTMMLRPGEWDILLITLVMVPSILFRSSDIIKYWFESIISAKYTVIAQNVAFLTSAGIKMLIMLMGGSYVAIAATVSLEALIVAVLLVYLYRSRTKDYAWSIDRHEIGRLLSQSWPLIISGLALMLYMRVDQIMIGNMINNTAVGIYSVAVKMTEVWYFFPVAIVSSLFPKIIKEKEISEDGYNKKMQFLYDLLVTAGVGLAIVVTLLSDYIIGWFYGAQYAEASRLIKIYAWVSVFYFLSSASGRWYINEGLQKYALNRNVLGLVMGILLNYLLIPVYGAEGSAYATLIAYACAAYIFDLMSAKTRIAFWQKTRALWIPGAILRMKNTLSR